MAQITAALVKQLREMTNSPMMECKKALVATDGDIEAAIDELRKMGVAKAVKRAGRDTNEGTIGAYVAEDGKTGALLELTCETDFVGTNPKFTGFACDLARVVTECDPADVEALMACPMKEATVADELTEMIHVIGENMKIVRFARVTATGALNSYIHLGGKLADIVSFGFGKPETAENEEFKTFAHDVAMQVVASAPVAARRDEVPEDIVEHEREIYRAQAAESGRPEKFWDGIVNGRLNKYFAESVLTEQVFIKDPNVKIADLCKSVGKACDDEIVIEGFTRFAFGE
jgi:elongation factor Ts